MKVRITLTEEALGSAPSNEDLLATYIASKAPTSELSAEEIDNIKAQNAEDRITVFYKSATRLRACSKIPARCLQKLARQAIPAAKPALR